MRYAWEEEEWADQVVIAPSVKRSECALPRQGSLWVSRTTRRRGSLLWALGGDVELCFTDHSSKVMTLEQLRLLYVEVF